MKSKRRIKHFPHAELSIDKNILTDLSPSPRKTRDPNEAGGRRRSRRTNTAVSGVQLEVSGEV